MKNPFQSGEPSKRLALPAIGSWPAAAHVFSQDEYDALFTALACGRPLLVIGEPGSGKSQLARAAAVKLRWAFRYDVVTPRYEPDDLRWRYDAVERLADAGQQDAAARVRALGKAPYTRPGVLWWALDPTTANAWTTARGEPADAQAAVAARGTVLLIDEIDKADSDLPNSLLEVLANRAFLTDWGLRVPRESGADVTSPGLLIIVTSNQERELPPAFVRRCAVLDLKVPDAAADLQTWLEVRGAAQFPNMAQAVRAEAARQTAQDRADAPAGFGHRPGLAEYLDLLRALDAAAPGDQGTQVALLERIKPYLLRKHGSRGDEAMPPADDEPRARG